MSVSLNFAAALLQDLKPSNLAVNEDCELKVSCSLVQVCVLPCTVVL